MTWACSVYLGWWWGGTVEAAACGGWGWNPRDKEGDGGEWEREREKEKKKVSNKVWYDKMKWGNKELISERIVKIWKHLLKILTFIRLN